MSNGPICIVDAGGVYPKNLDGAVEEQRLYYDRSKSMGTTTRIIARNQDRQAILSFPNEAEAKRFVRETQMQNLKFYKETTTVEVEEVEIRI